MLLELEPAEAFEPLVSDVLDAADMKRGSYELLKALCAARGLPEPKPPRANVEPLPEPKPVIRGNPFTAHIGIIPRLIDSVAEDFGITHGEIIGASRSRVFVHARAVVVRLMLDRGFSATDIGNRYLRRDHSSILWSRDSFDIYARLNPVVAESYARHSQMMRDAA